MPQEAIVAFEEILQDYPDLPVVHSLLGLAYQRRWTTGPGGGRVQASHRAGPRGREELRLPGRAVPRPPAGRAQAREDTSSAVAFNPLLDDAWFRAGICAGGGLWRPAEAFRILSWLQPDAVPPRGKLALVYQLSG